MRKLLFLVLLTLTLPFPFLTVSGGGSTGPPGPSRNTPSNEYATAIGHTNVSAHCDGYSYSSRAAPGDDAMYIIAYHPGINGTRHQPCCTTRPLLLKQNLAWPDQGEWLMWSDYAIAGTENWDYFMETSRVDPAPAPPGNDTYVVIQAV